MSSRNPADQSELAHALGRNVARLRREAGMSQGEVGEAAGLHPTAVGLIERGERAAHVYTLVRIAGALEVDASKLLESIAWTPGKPRRGRFITPKDAG
jgi:XRE family transcriptional regulator, regulator of sulfur utilization